MSEIYTRREIIDLIYSEYKLDSENREIISHIKKDMMKISDDEFVDFCKNLYINLVPIHKNVYYWQC